jgi:hypothetical protein
MTIGARRFGIKSTGASLRAVSRRPRHDGIQVDELSVAAEGVVPVLRMQAAQGVLPSQLLQRAEDFLHFWKIILPAPSISEIEVTQK